MAVVFHAWADREIERVRELSVKNMTAKEIAGILNEESGNAPFRTKNSVIGVMCRRGIRREETFNKKTKKIEKTTQEKAAQKQSHSYMAKNFAGRYDRSKIKLTPVSKPLLPEKVTLIDPAKTKNIMDLNMFDCKAVIGEPNGESTVYCGTIAVMGSSWCFEHRLRYVVRSIPNDKR